MGAEERRRLWREPPERVQRLMDEIVKANNVASEPVGLPVRAWLCPVCVLVGFDCGKHDE